jgi:hypothetical protein
MSPESLSSMSATAFAFSAAVMFARPIAAKGAKLHPCTSNSNWRLLSPTDVANAGCGQSRAACSKQREHSPSSYPVCRLFGPVTRRALLNRIRGRCRAFLDLDR